LAERRFIASLTSFLAIPFFLWEGIT